MEKQLKNDYNNKHYSIIPVWPLTLEISPVLIKIYTNKNYKNGSLLESLGLNFLSVLSLT